MVDIDPDIKQPATPKDAATVIVLREPFEVFMVRRHAKSGFMAGAYVFPGGRLDDADCDAALHAHALGRTPAQCAEVLHEDDVAVSTGLFFAAIRETFEEAGVLLAEGSLAHEERDRLHGHEVTLVQLAKREGLRFHLDLLVPQARWITPTVESRRYDTRFFLARASRDVAASHDTHETTDSAWMTPQQALDREAAGEISLPPPTLRTLQWLVEQGGIDKAFTAAAARKPPIVQPVFHTEGGVFTLALPGDPLHPVTEPAFEGATRFVLEKGRWWSRKG